MSEETTLKISIATVTSIGVAVLSLIVTVLMFWTGNISAKVNIHGEDIATLKQCVISISSSMSEIKTNTNSINSKVNTIEIRQAEHYGISKGNNTLLKKELK